jgi:hypothetical protein
VVEKGEVSSNTRRKERHGYEEAANHLIFGNFEDLVEWDIIVAERSRRHMLGVPSKVTSTTGSSMAEGEEAAD